MSKSEREFGIKFEDFEVVFKKYLIELSRYCSGEIDGSIFLPAEREYRAVLMKVLTFFADPLSLAEGLQYIGDFSRSAFVEARKQGKMVDKLKELSLKYEVPISGRLAIAIYRDGFQAGVLTNLDELLTNYDDGRIRMVLAQIYSGSGLSFGHETEMAQALGGR